MRPANVEEPSVGQCEPRKFTGLDHRGKHVLNDSRSILVTGRWQPVRDDPVCCVPREWMTQQVRPDCSTHSCFSFAAIGHQSISNAPLIMIDVAQCSARASRLSRGMSAVDRMSQ